MIPNGEIKILKPLENGIVSKILVKEGQKVKAGEALILVDPSVSSVNLQTHKENLAALLSAIARLVALSKEEQIKFEISKDERELYENQKISFYEALKAEEKVFALVTERLKELNFDKPEEFFANPERYRGLANVKAKALAEKYKALM